MKKKIFGILAALTAALCVSGRAWAAPPTLVSPIFAYQGSIFVDDEPFKGTGYFKLAIVDSTGATLWSNDGTSVAGSEPTNAVAVTVNEGVFQILLGDTSIGGMTAIDPAIFNTTDVLHLNSWFDDGSHGFSPFVPSIRITSSIYAMNSEFFRGYAPDDFLKITDQITSSQIAPGAVTSAAIAGGAVGATQISDGSVTNSKISAFTANSTIFTIGNGAAGTDVIFANQGAVNNPGLRFDSGTAKWQFSNNGTVWTDIGGGGGGGDVVGPGAATDNAVTRFDGVTGKLIQNSTVTISDAGTVNIPAGQSYQINGAALTQDNIGSGVTFKQYDPTSVAITGGTIAGTTINNSGIGGVTAAGGTFTDLISQNDTVVQGGDVTIGVGTTAYAGRVILHDANAGTSNTTTIVSNANVPASFTLTLPVDDGLANQVLQTDGAGALSWADQTSTTGFIKADGSVAFTNNQSLGGNNLTNVGTISLGTIQATGASFTVGSNWTNAGNTVANLGSVTTADINGGTVDGTIVGGATAANGTFTNLDAQTTFKLGATNQGDILYDNGTSIVRLTPGVSGQFLKTQGAAANPVWDATPAAPVSSVFTRTGAVTAQSNDYTWAQIDKTTSSIADITTRSAGDLSSGNLAVARMPTGGSWTLASDLNVDSNTFVVDQLNNRVGVGTAAPSVALEVSGDSKITGTENVSKINPTGSNDIQFYDAWDDMLVPVTSTNAGGTNPPAIAKFKDNGAGSQGVFTFSFSATTEQELYFIAQLPHSYKEGSDLHPHFHWTIPTNPTTGTQNVVWGLEYTWSNINDTYGNTTLTTVTSPNLTNADVGKHMLLELPVISGTGKTVSSVLVCRVYRAATDPADDYPSASWLFHIDFHFQKNTLGSFNELSKVLPP